MKALPAHARPTAVHGLFWLRDAFALFRRAPMLWLLMYVAYFFLVGLLAVIPWAGTLLSLLLRPVFSVGFLAAAWAQARGERPRFEDLFRGFQSNLRALLPLGVVQLIGINLALLATALADGGTLVSAIYLDDPLPNDFFLRPQTQWAMMLGTACTIPLILALWFAPALVVFEEAGAFAAIAASLRASLANWRAILVFAASVFMVSAVLPALPAQILILVLREAGLALALLLLLPLWLATAAVVQISGYVSYVDIFHAEPVAESDTANDDESQQ